MRVHRGLFLVVIFAGASYQWRAIPFFIMKHFFAEMCGGLTAKLPVLLSAARAQASAWQSAVKA